MKKTGRPELKENRNTRPKQSEKSPAGNSMKPLPVAWYSAGIIFSILLVYGKSLTFGFSPMDDTWLIVEKMEFLTDIRNFPNVFLDTTSGMFYRPVLQLSFMSDALISQSGINIYHAANVAFHVLATLALFRLLLELGIRNTTAALFCFIFALHPINVQAVAWIPGRNDSMLAMFVIVSCICLLRYLKFKERKWLLLHALLFVVAMLTKETAFLAPLVFGALLLLHGNALPKRGKISLSIAWMGLTVLTGLLNKAIVGPLNAGRKDFATTFVEFINGIVMQSGKALLPVQQSLWPLSENVLLLPFICAVAIVVALVLKFGLRDKKLAAFGLLWFLAFICLPTWYGAGSIDNVHYEHRMYPALPGLLLAISLIKIPLSEKFLQRSAIGIALVFAIVSFRRQDVYSSYDRYAQTAMEEAPQVALFHDLYGYSQHQKGKYQEAINSFNEAVKLDSTRPAFYTHRANSRCELKQYSNAISDYSKVLSMVPGQGQAWYNRSVAYYFIGDYFAASNDLKKADSLGAAIPPDYADALNRTLRMIELQQQFGQ